MSQLQAVSTGVLAPTDPNDAKYILDHEGEILSGLTLPSGVTITPTTGCRDWIAVEGYLALKLNPSFSETLCGFNRSPSGALTPVAEVDQEFLAIFQNASVTETTLPSGAKVPPAPNGLEWKVIDTLIKLKPRMQTSS